MLRTSIEGIVMVNLYIFQTKEFLERGLYKYCDVDRLVDFKEIYLMLKRVRKEFYIIHHN